MAYSQLWAPLLITKYLTHHPPSLHHLQCFLPNTCYYHWGQNFWGIDRVIKPDVHCDSAKFTMLLWMSGHEQPLFELIKQHSKETLCAILRSTPFVPCTLRLMLHQRRPTCRDDPRMSPSKSSLENVFSVAQWQLMRWTLKTNWSTADIKDVNQVG